MIIGVKMKYLSIVSILGLATLNSFVLTAGDAAKGQQYYAVCMACHGFNGEGNPVTQSPPLAGQEDWYVISQLKKFKEGIRGADPKDLTGMTMRPMSMTLPDEKAMEDVAAHILKLPKLKVKTTLNGDVEKGKVLYNTCLACHGPGAQGNPALKAPSIKQLPDWYIVNQLKKFKEGIRGTHAKDMEGMLMRPMSMTLVDEKAMADVAAYINSLQ